MDLNRFLTGLKELHEEITLKTKALENDSKKGFRGMSDLIQRMTVLLPEWFLFIEQTEIGTKEEILLVLRDMEEAMQKEDSVLLADTLLFGLQARTGEYIRIVEEALYEE